MAGWLSGGLSLLPPPPYLVPSTGRAPSPRVGLGRCQVPLVGRILFGRTGGFLLALIGAILLVILYRRVVQKRPVTGPEAHQWPRQ